MKALQITPFLSKSSGGPYVSVRRLSQELFSLGVKVDVAGIPYANTESIPSYWQPLQLHTVSGSFPRFLGYGAGLSEKIAAIQPDIVHSNGIWLYSHLAAYRYCATQKAQLVVSPRGMLEPWAFNHKRWKKLPLWWIYEKKSIQSASVLHATANQEADALRDLGFTNPIAVIPNGVDLPIEYSHRSLTEGIRTALFLSRIHPKKGLLNLIRAWSIVRPKGWRMVIVGPDENGHEAELREAVSKAKLEEFFEFVGPIFDERKAEYMRNASLFILPTFSENFGIAIAEALSYGVPVITTKGTPWSDLVERNCGWWADIGVEPLSESLQKATHLSDEYLLEMGSRGRQLVAEKYSWTAVAKDMLSTYEWILSGGAPPACVNLY